MTEPKDKGALLKRKFLHDGKFRRQHPSAKAFLAKQQRKVRDR